MQIHGLHHAQSAPSIHRAGASAGGVAAPAASRGASAVDQLDLSAEAQQLGQARSASEVSGGIRAEKVAAIRQAIADGSYETPEKLSAALDSLLDTFA